MTATLQSFGAVPGASNDVNAALAGENELSDKHPFFVAARAVAAVAAQYAVEVDRDARFPAETVAAMREHRLLSMSVPKAFGGGGATLSQLAAVCRILGEACSSSAMIYAMHISQLACLIDHAPQTHWFQGFFEELVWEQRLIASATSEETVGGDLRTSVCAVQPVGEGWFSLVKKAPTISYGAYADAILVTARRDPDASTSDQVLTVILKQDLVLQKTSGWDTLGMRGTSSGGFLLEGRGTQRQIVDVPFSEIAAQTMLPVSHVLWSSAWLGIATDAIRRGQKLFRRQIRGKSDSVATSGARLSEAFGLMRMMQSCIDSAIQTHDNRPLASAGALSYGANVQMNDLKIRMSQSALKIIEQMMQLCGMAAYKNDSPFSLGRHLRDLHSAPIMINNDRLAANMAVLMMAERVV